MITCLALSPSLDVTYLVESFTPGGIHRPAGTLRLAGGKAINVARALVLLGSEPRVIAPLGGSAGRSIGSLLAAEGIPLVTVVVDAETRSCVTIAAADDRELTEIYEPPTPIGSAWPQLADAVRRLSRESTTWLVVSGSVPADVDLHALAGLLADCRSAGIRVAIDTHGSALAVVTERLRADLVKVNRSEAAALLGLPTDAPLRDLATGLRERTSGLVVVTDGVNGSIAAHPDGVTECDAGGVLGQFSVGSGDCFLAGFLFAHIRGASVSDALGEAAACAAANALVPGAAIFDPAKLDAVRRGIRVH